MPGLSSGALEPTAHCQLMLQVLVFLYVSTKAFKVFEEQSPQFHLSDALYSVLELINATNAGSSSTETSTSSEGSSEDGSSTDLDALFSDFIGGGDRGVEDDAVDPGERLAPLLNTIELREHQKVAIKWMLWRENQQQKDYGSNGSPGEAESVANPVHYLSAVLVLSFIILTDADFADVGTTAVQLARILLC